MRAKVAWLSSLVALLIPVAVRTEALDPATLQLPFSIQGPPTASRAYTFRFSLFDSGILGQGSELWRELRTYRIPSSRMITHQLGSIVPFTEGMHGVDPHADPVPVDFSRQLWVEVNAGSFIRRVKLPIVPYAIYSLDLYGLREEQDPVSPNIIRGNRGNSVAAGVHGAAIAGGGMRVTYPDGTSQDLFNEILGNFGAIGGGSHNIAGLEAVVMGGIDNEASGDNSVILGAGDNHAYGMEASIAGGCGCWASGDGSVVVSGCSNTAEAYRSFAAGENANASRRGMFVWSASDDQDPDGGHDAHFSIVYEAGNRPHAGFPQELVGGVANPLLKDMQFWIKAPGGVFFVTGQDDLGQPLGAMLGMGSQQPWTAMTASPQMTFNVDPGRDSAGLAPAAVQTLQSRALDLSKRVAAQQSELAAGQTASALLWARLDELAQRDVELLRLLRGEPDGGSEFAGAGTGGAVQP